MSELLEKLQARSTGMRSVIDNKRKPLVSDISCDVDPRYEPVDFNDEYIARIEIGTIFRCNRAQYGRAYDQARKQLVREIYRDFMPVLDRAFGAAFSGEEREIIECLEEMKRLAGYD